MEGDYIDHVSYEEMLRIVSNLMGKAQATIALDDETWEDAVWLRDQLRAKVLEGDFKGFKK